MWPLVSSVEVFVFNMTDCMQDIVRGGDPAEGGLDIDKGCLVCDAGAHVADSI